MADFTHLQQVGALYLEARAFFDQFVSDVLPSAQKLPSFALLSQTSGRLEFSFCDVCFRFEVATSINDEGEGAFHVVSETKRDPDQGVVYAPNQSIEIESQTVGIQGQPGFLRTWHMTDEGSVITNDAAFARLVTVKY